MGAPAGWTCPAEVEVAAAEAVVAEECRVVPGVASIPAEAVGAPKAAGVQVVVRHWWVAVAATTLRLEAAPVAATARLGRCSPDYQLSSLRWSVAWQTMVAVAEVVEPQ